MFSTIEIAHLAIAWLFISLAFAIAFRTSELSQGFVQLIIFSAITVGVGFILHEMAHKIVAQRYGCFAEFRASFEMLVLGIIISFLGVVFAAPGAVLIGGRRITEEQNGKISIAGPLANIIISLIFLGLFFAYPATLHLSLNKLFAFGMMANAWIGAFNMIPFANIDGAKIIRWNKVAYFGLLAVAVVLMFVGFKLQGY